MFTFIHAADIHLDSPLKGLEQYEGAPADAIRSASRRALEKLVGLALERKVDFVLIAGDLYDGDWKDHNTGLFFVNQIERLRDVGIPVVMISGNHDAASKMTKSLRLPDNVERLSHSGPDTAGLAKLHELGVAVHGQSFAKAAELGNLAQGYPRKSAGMFNIGLLHTSLTGAEGHERYAPCSLDDLRSKGYDYWALGHIHTRQTHCETPYIAFSGNIQGRHVREPGAKGCLLVTVSEREEVQAKFEPLDVFRFATCEVSAQGADDVDEVLSRTTAQLDELVESQGSLPLGVRVRITGRCRAHDRLVAEHEEHVGEIRALAARAGGEVWIEKIQFRTAPERALNDESLTDGPFGELLQYVAELRGNPEEMATLAGELADLKKKLPDELRHGDDALLLDDPEWIGGLLDEVEPLLLSRLKVGPRS